MDKLNGSNFFLKAVKKGKNYPIIILNLFQRLLRNLFGDLTCWSSSGLFANFQQLFKIKHNGIL
ncbi:hypothetical protein APR40_05350 [Salegentibacter salarius]|uniref:Uncharacterized protein n=1 Tax=Salegentibacter salarius TaxID=435906 RepID=A0A2N0TNN1_9FLAO|nr:hypothetical protein BHS39_05350 [Salegentibacter salarius]PKD16345.1 hypothetical protein APR40_05350 [Salegentibacter salarius]